MDEYIPPAHPDAGSERAAAAGGQTGSGSHHESTGRAGGEPDLSALSEQEQQAVLAFSKQIDLENAQQILEYGASAQKNIADFSDTALAKVKTGDLGEIGDSSPACSSSSRRWTSRKKKASQALFRKGKDQRRGDEEPLRDGGGQCRPHLRRAGKAQDHAAEGRSRDGSDVRAEPAVLQGS